MVLRQPRAKLNPTRTPSIDEKRIQMKGSKEPVTVTEGS